MKKILILHSNIWSDSRADELDTLQEAQSVQKSLDNLWYQSVLMPFDLNISHLITHIQAYAPDRVFNLVEDVNGKGNLIHRAPDLLQEIAIPYTWCPAQAMFLTTQKIYAKECMLAHDIPTPHWYFPKDTRSKIDPHSTYIIKPLWSDWSLGIHETHILSWENQDTIIDLMTQQKKKNWLDFFAEEFIDGREFNLSLLEKDGQILVLPPAEIIFSAFENRPRIVSYKAKREEESFEYKNTRVSFSFPESDTTLLTALKKVALKCRDIFSLRWYARVDFRVDADNNIYVLEINANPCISPWAWFCLACEKQGISYDTMIATILASAI